MVTFAKIDVFNINRVFFAFNCDYWAPDEVGAEFAQLLKQSSARVFMGLWAHSERGML